MDHGHALVRSVLTGPLALLMLAATAGAAQAQADIVRFTTTVPLPTVGALPECLDATVGTQVGTETSVGQLVDTGTTFHAHGTSSLDYTVTFEDGRYVIGSSVEHFSFTAAGPMVVFTLPISEMRTIHSADGQPIGTVRIHAISHMTYRDANGNEEPDPGELSANVDRFFFTCR
jgi:hypothetical protein